MKNLTFEQLPLAVTNLTKEVSELKNLLIQKQKSKSSSEQVEHLLTIQEAGKFLKLSVPTLYSKVSKSEIPYMKRGKRLYFSATELLDYIKGGKVKSNSEIEKEASNYLLNEKKGLNNEKYSK